MHANFQDFRAKEIIFNYYFCIENSWYQTGTTVKSENRDSEL